MAPTNLSKIRREISELPDARKIFLLCEGTNTEPAFLEKILTNASYIDNPGISFQKVNKTENDKGVTDLNGLVKLAYEVMNNKENLFSKRKDKVVIFFDLDVYTRKHKAEEIKKIIEQNKKHIIFVFVNPAIELFLLLCLNSHSYESIIQPQIEAILKNEWIVGKDGVKRRFIYNLLLDISGVDSKNPVADFTVFSNGIQNGVNQEKMFLSQKIGDLSKHLVSNFGTIIDNFKNNVFDDIKYDIFG